MLDRFGHRHRLLGIKGEIIALARSLKEGIADPEAIRKIVDEHHPADIADAMAHLTDSQDQIIFSHMTPHEQAELLDEVDDTTLKRLVALTSPQRLAEILPNLLSDEAADVLAAVKPSGREEILRQIEDGGAIRRLLSFPGDSAGGIMSYGYVDVLAESDQASALQRFREKRDADPIFYVYAVEEDGVLVGSVDLRKLLTCEPHTKMREIADRRCVSVLPMVDQERVANIFSRYDLTALPVVDEKNILLGVITADDVIDVIQEEAAEDFARLSGTDAHELEQKSPMQIAWMRMPWIMATMFIELIAGFVVKTFDHTLAQILLLASFMPIISAISGNTGLQSAAIIIRGLSTGHVHMQDWRQALKRQMITTFILGSACGITLGIIGAIWYGKWSFGILVSVGMFASVNIAGAIGTCIPLVSKRFGFDPALTAGPFETAFQDVIGISIFLGMATLLLPYLK